MKKLSLYFFLSLVISSFCNEAVTAQKQLDEALAVQLARMPLHCIAQEYPNKTSHSAESDLDARLTPHELHPSFYGCFDWHSAVHGHWMLARILNTFPNIQLKDSIIQTLNPAFRLENMEAEAAYFSKYELGKIYERTYGWAWLLRLDQELMDSPLPELQAMHQNMQVLTQTIVRLWKDYIPKQTYPNRTGVHPNSAFAIAFALDWARAAQDTAFEKMLIQQALYFYEKDQYIPAYLEPNGSDFFSPSLCVADLMSRIYQPKKFQQWLQHYFQKRSIQRLCELPHVSDRNDYQITHLDGLCFSRAWNMRRITKHLPKQSPLRKTFFVASEKMLQTALDNLGKGNYGGSHWLASFAVYALTE